MDAQNLARKFGLYSIFANDLAGPSKVVKSNPKIFISLTRVISKYRILFVALVKLLDVVYENFSTTVLILSIND